MAKLLRIATTSTLTRFLDLTDLSLLQIAAMKRGVKFGRPKKLSPEQKELILKLREEGKSATELAKTFNVDRSTIYRLGE
ncbi:MAG: helix-turn-helix domain-containing protein [Cyanobacteria bacterium P01_A01_bin.83]